MICRYVGSSHQLGCLGGLPPVAALITSITTIDYLLL
jgi:hypothetical protein